MIGGKWLILFSNHQLSLVTFLHEKNILYIPNQSKSNNYSFDFKAGTIVAELQHHWYGVVAMLVFICSNEHSLRVIATDKNKGCRNGAEK